MSIATLDDATQTKVTDFIDKGKAEHEAGQHDQAIAEINETLKILGVPLK